MFTKLADGSLEFSNDIYPAYSSRDKGYVSHDVECLLNATLEFEEFQYKCGKPSNSQQ